MLVNPWFRVSGLVIFNAVKKDNALLKAAQYELIRSST